MASFTKRNDPAFASLGSMSPSAATPLQLEMAKQQAARRRPADLLRQLGRDAFVQPAPLDQRALHRLDGLALEAASDFEALELSPVAPLGTCSVLAPTDQDRTLSATRGTEVVSDPTNVLALECARRLRADPGADVRLCTVHQVVRAQALPPVKGFSRHFRLFALAEAGRGRPEDGFEIEAMVRHVAVFDRLLEACSALGMEFPNRTATVISAAESELLATRLHRALEEALPHVQLQRAALDSPYYDGVRVTFGAEDTSGELVPIGDTGRFDWVAQLTSNRRLRFVASGLGLQLAPLRFQPADRRGPPTRDFPAGSS